LEILLSANKKSKIRANIFRAAIPPDGAFSGPTVL
jgi:hypothetical protein